MWPAGFKSRRRCVSCSMLVFFFAMKWFSPGTPVFPSPQKPTFPNSNSSSKQVNEKPLSTDALPLNHYIFYYFDCLFFFCCCCFFLSVFFLPVLLFFIVAKEIRVCQNLKYNVTIQAFARAKVKSAAFIASQLMSWLGVMNRS